MVLAAVPAWAAALILVVLAWAALAVPAWAGFTVLAWAGGAALALLVLREWESPVQAGSLVQAGLLGQAEVIGPAAGGLAIGTGDIGGADAGGPG
ncbi:MAG: hypothetical protein WCF62_29060, partial [Pseudolabrys sp.]